MAGHDNTQRKKRLFAKVAFFVLGVAFVVAALTLRTYLNEPPVFITIHQADNVDAPQILLQQGQTVYALSPTPRNKHAYPAPLEFDAKNPYGIRARYESTKPEQQITISADTISGIVRMKAEGFTGDQKISMHYNDNEIVKDASFDWSGSIELATNMSPIKRSTSCYIITPGPTLCHVLPLRNDEGKGDTQ